MSNPASFRLSERRTGPMIADQVHSSRQRRTRSRRLCPACQAAVRDQFQIDPAGRIAALADPKLLTAASTDTRTAALVALMADRNLWPALLGGLFTDPALHRLILERLRRELFEHI